jgi:NitT/TauT family transport system ATP-binding protein
MEISITNGCFAFTKDAPIFMDLNIELRQETSPVIILGQSGCGKTTLLKLLAGLLKLEKGEIKIKDGSAEHENNLNPVVSFVFQEPRLFAWKTVLENVSLPLLESFGKKEAIERSRMFLSMVALEEKADVLPKHLSGGQQQRVNLARAFALPSRILLMDEPFQSLDIPLRLQLMDLTLRLLENFPGLAIMVSHDPREAIYLGKRVVVLGKTQGKPIHDELINLSAEERHFGSAAQNELEKRFLSFISG